MKYCEWCGDPMKSDARATTKYHEQCRDKAALFRNLLANNPGLPEEVSTHESGWHYMLRRLDAAAPEMVLARILSPAEWNLMCDMVKTFNECFEKQPNEKRLRQLTTIGERLLSMPGNTPWEQVPNPVKLQISRYVGTTIQYWKKHSKDPIPKK